MKQEKIHLLESNQLLELPNKPTHTYSPLFDSVDLSCPASCLAELRDDIYLYLAKAVQFYLTLIDNSGLYGTENVSNGTGL